MRNLKKLLAVIVSVCVLATFALPAFAAETTTLTDAQISEKLGAVKGDTSQGVTDEYLAKGTTRLQAAIIYLRMLNLEEEALAFESEDNFADAADVPWAGGRAILAYLKANPELGWQGVSETTFEPNGAASAQMMYKVALEALGYKQGTDFEWADVFTFAEDKGLGKAADLAELTNNDMCTIVVEMLGIKVKDGDVTLIEKLVADGVIAEADAIEVGLIAATPDELEIESVTATNLIQAVVTFNQKVDKDTATDKDNYSFATADKIEIDNAALADDGVSVVLTFKAATSQQKTAKLTVNNVKSAEGVKMAKTTEEVYFLDSTIPEVVSAEVIGISTIKVTFSEPMQFGVTGEMSADWVKYFKVNDGKYYVKSVEGQSNNTEFKVSLYTSLKEGDLPFEIKVGPKDYAGFTAIGYSTTLPVNEDKEAPYVVSFKDAKPNSVTLIWNEDIEVLKPAVTNYYHTNSTNDVSKAPEIDGKEMKLTFSDSHKLPNGTAYVYVLKEAVKDYWNNKNAQQMVKLDVVVDNDAPVLQSIDVKAENKIVAVYDEAVKAASATKRANYTVLDKDGKEVKNIISTLTVDDKKVTITFVKNLDGGDYTLVVKDVEDLAGNEMDSTSMAFTITDKTPPVATDFKATLYYRGDVAGKRDQIIKVSFGQEMAIDGTYSIDDLAKYILKTGTKRIEKIDDVTISVVDDGKGVEIVIPEAKYAIPSTDIKTSGGGASGGLTIARVADAAGNYTEALTNVIDLNEHGNVTIEKAELIEANKVKVYFSDLLSNFVAEEITMNDYNPTTNPYTEVNTTEEDGKMVAIFTLKNDYTYDAKDSGGNDITVKTVADPTAENQYGEKLKDTTGVTVKDKVAPGLNKIKIGDDDKDDVVLKPYLKTTDGDPKGYKSEIILTFNEKLDGAYLGTGAFNVAGFDVYSYHFDGDKTVTLTIWNDDQHVPVENGISLNYAIRDDAGNALSELNTSVTKDSSADDLTAAVNGIGGEDKKLDLASTETGNVPTGIIPTVEGYGITIKAVTIEAGSPEGAMIETDGTVTATAAGTITAKVVYTVTCDITGNSADTGEITVTIPVTLA